jgi:hypothetical protein
MNVYLDIDDVIFDWHKDYAKRFNCKVPKHWSTAKIMKDRLQILSTEKEFWLNLTVKNRPNFIPAGFVSARGISKSWTIESLKKFNIPGRSVVHQVPWGESKINLLKELNCDIFVDDKYATFKECNKAGIFCLLMDAPHNQHIKTPYRIYTLDIDNILYLWRKLR